MTLDELVSETSAPVLMAKADGWLKRTYARKEDFAVGLMGNRVTLASRILALGGIATFLALDIPREFRLEAFNVLAYTTLLPSVVLMASTNCGTTTLDHYRRTRKHMRGNGGKLDLRFAEALIEGSGNDRFFGYCQQQGLYLAAKRYGQLDVFNEAKKKSNIVIPFF